MASHFLLYASIEAPSPKACASDADMARDFAVAEAAAGRGRLPVVRLLTGACPVCGRSVSRLTGKTQPRQPWEVRG